MATPARAVTGRDDADWLLCPGCGQPRYLRRLRRDHFVCHGCRHHFPLDLDTRLALICDPGSFHADPDDVEPVDLLGFVDSRPYAARLAEAQAATGRRDAVLTGRARILEHPVQIVALDFDFLGGSMGSVVGERFDRAAQAAREGGIPLLMIAASGGARMQEGLTSLMQLAKTAQAIAELREAGIPTINLNTHPTFGGATASFAMLGDVVLAEPGAQIGFAGPKVIAQTIGADLPAGFQTAEFLLEHGMVDLVVPREAQRDLLGRLLGCLRPGPRHLELVGAPPEPNRGPATTIPAATLPTDIVPTAARPAADIVAAARDLRRPTALEHLAAITDDLIVLAGDRMHGDDPALIAGVARIGERGVVVLGHQKGHTSTELVASCFGMPRPEGYRKATRLMRLAERLGLPVVSIIDTPGAFPGVDAEQRGQGGAIAEAILTLGALRTPVVSVVTGEGGSGGALAISVADRLLMLDGAYYSVISPEGAATILFGSAQAAAQVAQALRLRAADLLELGLVDEVIPEPPGGAGDDPAGTTARVRSSVHAALADLGHRDVEQLLRERRRRIRGHGRFVDHATGHPPTAAGAPPASLAPTLEIQP